MKEGNGETLTSSLSSVDLSDTPQQTHPVSFRQRYNSLPTKYKLAAAFFIILGVATAILGKVLSLNGADSLGQGLIAAGEGLSLITAIGHLLHICCYRSRSVAPASVEMREASVVSSRSPAGSVSESDAFAFPINAAVEQADGEKVQKTGQHDGTGKESLLSGSGDITATGGDSVQPKPKPVVTLQPEGQVKPVDNRLELSPGYSLLAITGDQKKTASASGGNSNNKSKSFSLGASKDILLRQPAFGDRAAPTGQSRSESPLSAGAQPLGLDS